MPDTMIQSPATGAVMPIEISKALGEVMSKIKSLPKGEYNQHSNYNFASIDDFLAAIGPLCSASGLLVFQDEESLDMIDRGGKAWLKITYSFTLGHISGVMSDQAMRRTVFQSITGPQTTGSSQSYALKMFLRSLLMIPTGDRDDADYHKPQDMPAAHQPQQARQEPQGRAKPNQRPTQPKTAEAIQRSSSESDELTHMAIQVGNSGPLFGKWTKMALETLEGRPEEWRRRWVEMHENELDEVRAFSNDYADRIASIAISPDLPREP
jgi:hypothetical protein